MRPHIIYHAGGAIVRDPSRLWSRGFSSGMIVGYLAGLITVLIVLGLARLGGLI